MLRINLLQHWSDLSGPAAEDATYDSGAIRASRAWSWGRRRCGTSLQSCASGTCWRRDDLIKATFRDRLPLEERGLLLKQGTIVDATIIAAPSSTKNQSKSRDPRDAADEEGQRVALRDEGARGDHKRGIVDSLTTTNAAEADVNRFCRNWCRARTRALWRRRILEGSRSPLLAAREGLVSCEPARSQAGPLTEHCKRIYRTRSPIRERGEHASHVVKRLWGFGNVRYRRLKKNSVRGYAAFALADLYLLRREPLVQGA